MEFPQYISVPQRTTSVVGYVDKDNTEKEKGVFIDGKGYIAEDQSIWIYSGGGEPKNKNQYPYFWLNKDGVKEFSDPDPLIRSAYSMEHLKDMSVVSIIENTDPNTPLFDEQEIEDMNAAAEVYIPIINQNDDFLKKIVKTAIIVKGIDINRLKSKTDEKYILPNMKAALQGKTKMSVVYFCCWMNLLGLHFEFTVIDNGEDTTNPLKNPLVYQSSRDALCTLVNGELIDFETEKYMEEKEEDE